MTPELLHAACASVVPQLFFSWSVNQCVNGYFLMHAAKPCLCKQVVDKVKGADTVVQYGVVSCPAKKPV